MVFTLVCGGLGLSLGILAWASPVTAAKLSRAWAAFNMRLITLNRRKTPLLDLPDEDVAPLFRIVGVALTFISVITLVMAFLSTRE